MSEWVTPAMIDWAIKAIRKAYHAALLAPADWAPTEFDCALDCVLTAFGLEVEERGRKMQEAIAEEVRNFVRGGTEPSDPGPEAHELGDKRPTLEDMKY